MSARSDAAKKVAEFVAEHELDLVFGGDEGYKENKKYRSVTFSLPSTLDGQVRVYNEKFILVFTAGALGMGKEAFNNVDDALAYMKARWVDGDDEAADAVPQRDNR